MSSTKRKARCSNCQSVIEPGMLAIEHVLVETTDQGRYDSSTPKEGMLRLMRKNAQAGLLCLTCWRKFFPQFLTSEQQTLMEDKQAKRWENIQAKRVLDRMKGRSRE